MQTELTLSSRFDTRASTVTMEMYAVSARKAVPSTFLSSFSDQSHLQFYGRGESIFLTPSKLPFRMPSCRTSASKFGMAPLRAFCTNSCAAAVELTAEEDLMKELVDLKVQMRQKKKELKARMKEDKKTLKIQMKEEKKRKKQKDAEDGKTKCESESSLSSSESCDEGCSSVSMKVLWQSPSMPVDTMVNREEGPVLEICVANCSAVTTSNASMSSIIDTMYELEGRSEKSSMSLSGRGSSEFLPTLAEMGSIKDCASTANDVSELVSASKDVTKSRDISPCKSRLDGGLGASSQVSSALCTSNRVEVCTGGKCKKAGSGQLLSALQSQIPRSANVEAVPCKCMGRCSMAVNVRVLKEDTNPQHHSHVDVEDGSLILSHHFGLGYRPARLPTLSQREGVRVSIPVVTA